MRLSRLRQGAVMASALALMVAAGARAQVVAPQTGPPASDPCASPTLLLRCPDLVMSAPYNLEMDRSTEPGHALLRAASSIDNHGPGPIALIGRRAGSTMSVSQVIYDARGQRHVYATSASLVYKYIPGYRYRHPAVGNFAYWKLHNAAGFTLWSVDANFHALALVRTGPKLDYCLRDFKRTFPSRRSPGHAVFGPCSIDPYISRDVLGTSVGWSDIYPYEYPQQWIDVSGLRGHFAYVETADPLHLLHESNAANNLSETFVSLPSGRVLGHRTAITAP